MIQLDEHPTVKRFRERATPSPVSAPYAPLEAEWLRQLCLDSGADDVGFVGVSRPEIADQRDDIAAAFPNAKTLISFVCRMNRENIRTPARSVANLEFHHAGEAVDEVARRIVAELERSGVRAMNGGAMAFPMEMDRWPEKLWVISHKPVAVAAALADALDARMSELTDVPQGGFAPHPDLDARRPQWLMPAAGEARPSPRSLPAWLRRGGPRRRSWLLDMLRDGRLVTHFQPIVCANAPDAVLGYEALLRGQAQDGTLVEPKPLYQAARATGLLFHLDRLARLTAIRGAAVHRVTTQLFINFTPSSIYDPASSLRSTMSAIAASGISSERIVLEVVESEEIRDVQHLLDVLDTYRAAGFGVALDDLGAGYSSLTLLTRLKPEFLKLDAELVHNVDADPYRAAIVAKLLELASSLRIRTVAEGIETEGEWWWCREHDVDYVQGYLFARPGLPPPMPGL